MKPGSRPLFGVAAGPATNDARSFGGPPLFAHSSSRYGASVVAVAVSLGVKLVFEHFHRPFPFTACSLVAIAVTVWYCGIGPGVLALALSSLAVVSVVPPPIVSGSRVPFAINHVLSVAIVVWISASRLRAERLLSQARGELERKVEARTTELRQANEDLRAEITERKRVESALRASDQVARGQVEALAHSLDLSATAPAPVNLIGQMLGTMGRLLHAQSVHLWLLDEAKGSLVLRAAAEGENFTAADSEHPFITSPWFWENVRALQELFFTGAPAAVEEIEADPRLPGALRDYFRSKGIQSFLLVPTLVAGQVKGFVSVRHRVRQSYRPEEIELAQALAHQAMFAVQLDGFAAQSQQAAVLEERNRMARDIHDTLAQGFMGVIVQLEAAEDAVSSGERSEADAHLHRAGKLARESLSEARRSVHALRPQALQDVNFWEALTSVIKNTTIGTPLRTRCQLHGTLLELPALWQENLLHLGQEALTNTLKYAHARNFDTSLSFHAEEVGLTFQDDGDGFEAGDPHDGIGHAGMRERVEQMGGTLTISSSRGSGTRVMVVLPLHQSALR